VDGMGGTFIYFFPHWIAEDFQGVFGRGIRIFSKYSGGSPHKGK